jgi:hypothetical protein
MRLTPAPAANVYFTSRAVDIDRELATGALLPTTPQAIITHGWLAGRYRLTVLQTWFDTPNPPRPLHSATVEFELK